MFGGALFFLYELKEAAVHYAPLRWLYFLCLFRRALNVRRRGREYDAINTLHFPLGINYAFASPRIRLHPNDREIC